MLPGRIFCLVLCVVGTAWATKDEGSFLAEGGGVRGPRVVERVSSSCKEGDWPFCSDEDWTYKCPSGCRMKGLIDETNEDFTNRITKIRNLLFDYQRNNKDSSSVTRTIMEVLRGDTANDYNNDNAFSQVSDDLRRRIETLKRKVTEQVQKIVSLQNDIRNQLVEMKRLEVDIDIKIRSCKGSCSRSLARELNIKSYEEEQKQLEQVAAINLYPSREVQYLPNLKMQIAKDLIPGKFKSQLQEAPEWKALMEMKQMEMVLETPGRDRNSPAGASPSGTGSEPGSTRPGNYRPESPGSGISGTQNFGGTESRYIENSGSGSFRPDSPGHGSYGSGSFRPDISGRGNYGSGDSRPDISGRGNYGSGDSRPDSSGRGSSRPANPDWGHQDWSRYDESSASGSSSRGGGFQTSKLISGGDKEFVVSKEKAVSGATTTRRSCSKTITKTVVGPDGRKEVTKEVVNSEDGADCGDIPDFNFEHPESGSLSFTGIGSLDEFHRLHPEHAKFFSTGSTGFHSSSNRGDSSYASETSPESGSKVSASHLDDEDTDDLSSFHFGEPVFSPASEGSVSHRTVVSSSKTFSKGSKSLKMADEADGEIHREESTFIKARSSKGSHSRTRSARDCDDVLQIHPSGAPSGLFSIKPAGSSKFISVYCDQETSLGGWLLIQQRSDGSLNFNRTWRDYKRGFGKVNGKGEGEFWLGNEYLHLLTQRESVLRVELEDWDGNEVYAEYNVRVGSEAEGYVLRISSYGGTAGDALIEGSVEEGTEYTSHANMQFSTFDQDNDQWEENCAEMYGGGWWYNNCQGANLNGIYYPGGSYDPRDNSPYEIENGVVWIPFRGSDYSLRTVRMKIRPLETQWPE
ncbi:fibrinogen alpha chain [Phascolarctos cinereus]|uniref:Fibrinogen alpha chain n=1 Tax=Phascolarctos cinereus TaxID=38626 RepID=A0A6P5KVG1_PHACI|nr:fibrinogen alpha chain [Phascolarctos cinereus]